jgi:tetratricopeptide (TPR) repeat protein
MLFTFSLCSFAQKKKNEKVLKGDEAKALLNQVPFDSTVFLQETGEVACNCIDSVNKSEKNKEKKLAAFSKCIDEQAQAYQLAEKILGTMKGTSNKIELNINESSDEHKHYYYKIERWLRDSCATLNRIINSNDEARDKSFSTNQEAMKAYYKGVEFLKQENYDGAIPYFEQAVKLDSEFAFAWDNLGISYRKTNKLELAEAAYKASLKADPGGKTALQNLAVVYQYQKKYDEAIVAFKEILKYSDEDPETYYGIGLVYYNNKEDMEEALKNMCKAYNIYVSQKSAFRSDAEKVINLIYARMKKDKKEDVFNRILKENNINAN